MSDERATLLYELVGVGKEYDAPGEKLAILRQVDLRIAAGDSVAVLGASGAGKSTLLHLLGTLDTASWGTLAFRGREPAGMSPAERAEVRNRDIGFVFQFHHLLPEFDTLENAAMPLLLRGERRARAMDTAREALAAVGLEHRLEHKVTTLSGGERQRAAIARAIVTRPRVLLADEPTGNLDERTGNKVAELLLQLNDELGMALVTVTHNTTLAGLMDRRLELRSGELHAQAD
ncbi:MAG: ABC transporter ATP-binding protein [Desulfovibrionaceae bacterium]|jgi:lipoprotein-releasing system ATP-binding protein|nr:ABC transporter ATP-binding protein [Desulfovibrionaceae bacterium]